MPIGQESYKVREIIEDLPTGISRAEQIVFSEGPESNVGDINIIYTYYDPIQNDQFNSEPLASLDIYISELHLQKRLTPSGEIEGMYIYRIADNKEIMLSQYDAKAAELKAFIAIKNRFSGIVRRSEYLPKIIVNSSSVADLLTKLEE